VTFARRCGLKSRTVWSNAVAAIVSESVTVAMSNRATTRGSPVNAT
jgi:hypothetical protein